MALTSPLRIGGYLGLAPREDGPLFTVHLGFRIADDARRVVEIVHGAADDGDVRAPPRGSRHAALPEVLDDGVDNGRRFWVRAPTAGVSVFEIWRATLAAGAAIDREMAFWLVEQIGRAALVATELAAADADDVVVRFDDGQPLLARSPRRRSTRRAHHTARMLGLLVKDAGQTAELGLRNAQLPDAVRRAAEAALRSNNNSEVGGHASTDRELLALVDALAQARRTASAELKGAWHGAVLRLFPDEAEAHRALVDEIGVYPVEG